MSLNPDERFTATVTELYMALKYNKMLGIAIRACAKMLSKRELSKREKAGLIVWFGILSRGDPAGSRRSELEKKVTKIGYGRSYASKIVDEELRRYQRWGLVDKVIHSRGSWGKQGSNQGDAGRPPATYKIRLPELPPIPEELERLKFLVSLLSGNLFRLIKTSYGLRAHPLGKELLQTLVEDLRGLPEPLVREFDEYRPISQDQLALELKELDQKFDQIMEPVKQRANEPFVASVQTPSPTELGDFKSIRFRPDKVKLLFNKEVESLEGKVSVVDTLTCNRKGLESIVVKTRSWVASPLKEKVEADEIVLRIQEDLAGDSTKFRVCGVVDGTLELEGNKEIMDEIEGVALRQRHPLGRLRDVCQLAVDGFIRGLDPEGQDWTSRM